MPAPHITLSPWQAPNLPPFPNGEPYPAASAHTGDDALCKECPHCVGLHVASIKANEDLTAATDPAQWAAYEAAVSGPLQAFFDLAHAQMRAAQDWWTACGMMVISIQRALNDMWARYGSMMDGHVDVNRISFTPREGWILVEPTVGLKVWVATEEDIPLVQGVLANQQLLAQMADLNAQYMNWETQRQAAQAASEACDAHYQAELAAAQAWAQSAVDAWNQFLRDVHAESHRAEMAYKACIRDCKKTKWELARQFWLLVAGGLLFGGATALALAQPFDTGRTEIAVGPTEVVEVVDDTPAESDTEPSVDGTDGEAATSEDPPSPLLPPDLTADEVMIDDFLRELLGISMIDDDIGPFRNDPNAPGKFALPGVTPVPYTSFYGVPLAEVGMADNLGPIPAVTHAGTTVLTLTDPLADPQRSVVDKYGPMADVVFAPAAPTGTVTDTLIGIGVVVDADLTDPATCSGMDLNFVVNVNNPSVGMTYQADPAFPGDYYQRGNLFTNFNFSSCSPGGQTDAYGAGGLSFGAPNTGGGLMTVVDGQTHAVFFLPGDLVESNADLTTIFFEHPTGQPFLPENTRYQSMPDIFGPRTALATDAVTTTDCDFGLGPVFPTPTPTTGGATPSSVPAPTPSTGGGGTPPSTPTPSTDTGGGGSTPSSVPGTDGGTDPGAQPPTVDPGGETVVVDPDETNPVLAGLGAAASAAGGALLAQQTQARRREEDEAATASEIETDSPASGPPPTTPNETPSGPRPTAETDAELERAMSQHDEAMEAAKQAALERARTNQATAERDYRAAVSRLTARQSAEDNESWSDWVHDKWTGKDEREETLLTRARQEVTRTRNALRTANAELLAVELASVAPEERADRLATLEAPFIARSRNARSEAFSSVERVIMDDADDRVRAQTLAMARTEMEIPALFTEAVMIARSRLGPTAFNAPATLDSLASSVRDTRRQRTREYNETDASYETREWMRDTDRTIRVNTYIAVAEQATVYDSDTQAPISTTRRRKVAFDRLTWVAEKLEWASWRNDDSRDTQAAEIRDRLKENYRSLDYLGYGHASMSELFLATSSAIRQRQTDVNTWFLSDYLGLKDRLGSEAGQDDGNWWRLYWASANTGLGTYWRMRGVGEDNMQIVQSRIKEMNDDADIAVLALTVAARTKDPNEWPTEMQQLPNGSYIESQYLRDLLEEYGYISRDRRGNLIYQMPTNDTMVARETQIKLPGASALDVISARNIGEVMLSVALPEYASLRIATWVGRLGVAGARWATAVRVLTEQGLGFALDVGLSYAGADGKKSLETVAAESLINNVAGLLSRAGTDRLARAGVDRMSTGGPLSRLLADPDNKRIALEVVSETLGIPGDAASQLIVQAASGHNLSETDVLSALLGAAMNRGISRSMLDSKGFARLRDQIPTEAVAMDRRLNSEAESTFDGVLGDKPLTTETGDSIFEALRLGDLTWEQLQRVYSIRGDSMKPVMLRVNDLRNRLVNSIGTRARLLARERITEHYDRLISEAAPADRASLQREKQAELDLVADPNTEATVAMAFTSEALDVSTADRAELVDRLTGTDLAKDVDLASLGDLELRDLAIRELESRYTEAVRKAAGDEIAPGSAGATSDVDRSWSSEFLRRAAREVVLHEMMRGRTDGGLGPTTARAFDVNEYGNVMLRIPSMIEARETFAGRVIETFRVARPDGSEHEFALTHVDAVEANSLAAAMLHMDPDRRRTFESNKKDGLTGQDLDRMNAMFEWAKRSLTESDEALATYIERERRRPGRSPHESEVELRARDELYADRMRQLEQLGHAIDSEGGDTPRRRELMSQWELLMNQALRDGIETYSDMANLEIIVIRMQTQKDADGNKLDPTALMRSEDFKLGGKALKGITEQQIRSMLNDQILMLMHHVHTLHAGYESPAKATRSFAKYAERALLALNLLGEFDPDTTNQYSELFTATRALMEHKNNPKKLLETLENLRPEHRGDATANLRWYLDQIEMIPGMRGLTAAPPRTDGHRRWGETLAGREWMRQRLAALESGRPGSWEAQLASGLHVTLQELIEVTHDLEIEEALSGFLPEDRHRASILLDEIDELMFRVTFTPGDDFRGAHLTSLWTDLRTRQAALEALAEKWRAAGEPKGADIENRLRQLRARKAALEAERDRVIAELQRSQPASGR